MSKIITKIQSNTGTKSMTGRMKLPIFTKTGSGTSGFRRQEETERNPINPPDRPYRVIPLPSCPSAKKKSVNGRASHSYSADSKSASESSKDQALSMDWIRKALASDNVPTRKKAITQYEIDTIRMVQDVRRNIRSYVGRILQVKTTEDAVVLLKLFRRILPAFIEEADWKTALFLTRAVDKAAKTTVYFAAASGLPANPLELVFKNHIEKIVFACEGADAESRKIINAIAERLDGLGIEIMANTLSACKDRDEKKGVLAALINKGEATRNWILSVLDASGQKWYLKRTALMLLKYVGKKEREIDRARRLVYDAHPSVREAALNVLMSLQVAGAEEIVIAALYDPDDKVRRRAMSCLTRLSPLSERVIKKLLAKLSVTAPRERKKAVVHYRQIAQMIKALGTVTEIPNHAEAEQIILPLVCKLSQHKKGLFRRIKDSILPEHSDVLSAAITVLGKIGTNKSESFLEKLADSNLPQAEHARLAANKIKLRYISLLSNAPPEVGLAAVYNPENLQAGTSEQLFNAG